MKCKHPQRMVICAKEIMQITGKTERTARRIIAAIRHKNNLPSHAHITIQQFSQYTGLPEQHIAAFLNQLSLLRVDFKIQ